MHQKFMYQKSGFTLVQLSMVLVIIGLLAGAVVAGQEILAASRMQAQISQFYTFQSAYVTFKDKFGAVPGDFSGASVIWSGATNGNGNGALENSGNPYFPHREVSPNYAFDNEFPQFFRHLSLAGLVTGEFDGTFNINRGYPELKASPGKGMIVGGEWEQPSPNMQPKIDDQFLGKIFIFAFICDPTQTTMNAATVCGSWPTNVVGVWSAQTALSIDNKIDDGLPFTGKFLTWVMGNGANTVPCFSAWNVYEKNGTTSTCSSAFQIGY